MKNGKFKELVKNLKEGLKDFCWLLTNLGRVFQWANFTRRGYPHVETDFVRIPILPDENRYAKSGGRVFHTWEAAVKEPLGANADCYRISFRVSHIYPTGEYGISSEDCSGFFYPDGVTLSYEELTALKEQMGELSANVKEEVNHCHLHMWLCKQNNEPLPVVVRTRHGHYRILEPGDQIVPG